MHIATFSKSLENLTLDIFKTVQIESKNVILSRPIYLFST